MDTLTIKPCFLDFFILRSLWITWNWSRVAKAVLIISTNHNGFHWRAVHEAMFKIRMCGEKRLYGQTDLFQVQKQKCTGDRKTLESRVHTRTQAGYTFIKLKWKSARIDRLIPLRLALPSRALRFVNEGRFSKFLFLRVTCLCPRTPYLWW